MLVIPFFVGTAWNGPSVGTGGMLVIPLFVGTAWNGPSVGTCGLLVIPLYVCTARIGPPLGTFRPACNTCICRYCLYMSSSGY